MPESQKVLRVKMAAKSKKTEQEECSFCDALGGLVVCAIALGLLASAMYFLGFLRNKPQITVNEIYNRFAVPASKEVAAASTVVNNECGGVVNVRDGYKGYIMFKNGTTYNRNERCAWIVNSATKRVNITFISQHFGGFPVEDGCIVGELDASDESFSCRKWIYNWDYYSTRTVKTPAVIYFTSGSTSSRRGFVVELVPVENKFDIFYDQIATYHVSKRKEGAMAFSSCAFPNYGTLLWSITVFQPFFSGYNVKRNFTVTPAGANDCRYVLAAYELPQYDKITYGPCCSQNKELRDNGTFVTSNAMLVLVWSYAPNYSNGSCMLTWSEAKKPLIEARKLRSSYSYY